MIHNVVFDLGQVLINYQPEAYVRSFGFDDQTERLVLDTIFNNKCWKEFDRGTLSLDQGMALMIREAPQIESQIRQVFDKSWMEILTLKEDTAQFLKQLKQAGYNIYVLSNFSEVGFQFIYPKYDFFGLIDGKVVSYEIKSIKPEPAIYVELIERYDIAPHETIFIDDLQENLTAAQKFGIKTILFTNLEDVKQEFYEKTLVDIRD